MRLQATRRQSDFVEHAPKLITWTRIVSTDPGGRWSHRGATKHDPQAFSQHIRKDRHVSYSIAVEEGGRVQRRCASADHERCWPKRPVSFAMTVIGLGKSSLSSGKSRAKSMLRLWQRRQPSG